MYKRCPFRAQLFKIKNKIHTQIYIYINKFTLVYILFLLNITITEDRGTRCYKFVKCSFKYYD